MAKISRFSGSWKCSACSKLLAPIKISQHSLECEQWKKKFGDPLPKFKFSPFNKDKQPLYLEGAVEAVDYLQCKICATYGYDLRFSRIVDHLKAHEMSREEYERRYQTKTNLEKTTERRKKTSFEKYGVDSVSKVQEFKEKIKQTNMEKYGSENPMGCPEVRAKIEATNLQKYGAKNVFELPDMQQYARQRMVEVHGAYNPALVPEIVARRRETCLERYGGACYLSSPEHISKIMERAKQRKQVRRQALIESGNYEICHFCNEVYTKVTSRHKAICEGWHDKPIIYPCLCSHESTSNTQMKRHKDICGVWQDRDKEKVKRERFLATLQENYGEQYTSPFQVPEIQDKIRETCRKVYGVDWASMSQEVQDKMMITCLERHGVPYSGQSKEVQNKARQTNLGRYGSENPFGSIEIQEKILRSCLGQVGLNFPEYEFPAISKEDLIDRYGYQYPMQNKEYALKVLQSQHTDNGPNKFESKILDLCPQLIYTGDSAWWRWLPKLGHHKNPDFLVPGPDLDFPRRGVTKVIEGFGDYFHGPSMTGKSNYAYELEVVEAYAEIGISCLVLWETEVMRTPEEARKRIEDFLVG